MEKFIQLGENFGLEGETLLEFLREQQELEREEKRRQLEEEKEEKRRRGRVCGEMQRRRERREAPET